MCVFILCYYVQIRGSAFINSEGECNLEQDNTLLQQAKEGSEDAFESIFKQYLPIVLTLKNRYYLRDYDLDDWLQEGRIVCYQSLMKYDPNINVTFGLFFKINFERWIVSALRFQEAKKRQIYRVSESLEYRIELKGEGVDMAEEDSRAETSMEYIFVRESLEGFSTYLSKFEIQIYQYVLQGEDLDSIAQQLNVSKQKVLCGYSRLKKKLKDQISE